MPKVRIVLLCLIVAGCVEAGDGPLQYGDTSQGLTACTTTPLASRDCTNPQGQTGFINGFGLVCGVTVPSDSNCVYANGTRYNVGTESACAGCYLPGYVYWTTIRGTWHLHDPIPTDAQLLANPVAWGCGLLSPNGTDYNCSFYDRTYSFSGFNAGYFNSPSSGTQSLTSTLNQMTANPSRGFVIHYQTNIAHENGTWSVNAAGNLTTTEHWVENGFNSSATYTNLQITNTPAPPRMSIYNGRTWAYTKQ